MPSTTTTPGGRNGSSGLTATLVDRIAELRGVDPTDPGFCLYEDVDLEALELLFHRSAGPLETRFRVEDLHVTVSKTAAGEVTVEVEADASEQNAG